MKKIAKETSSLLEILETMYPDSSKRTLRNFLKAKRVTVNGEVEVRPTAQVVAGQEITVHKEGFKKSPLPILFEDEYVLAIDKPSGLLSVPLDPNVKRQARNALTLLREENPNLYPVHRLDRDTSGVLIFAKSKKVRDLFCDLFKEHNLTREYHAIAEGLMKEDKGTWSSLLTEHNNLSISSRQDKGKRAITHFEVIKRERNCTYLKLKLETGRKHQIRVHCKEAGYPLLGDRRYGSKSKTPLKLRAERLAFTHPVTGEWIDIKGKRG